MQKIHWINFKENITNYPFIFCVESNDVDPVEQVVLECSKKLNLTIDLVEKCMHSNDGNLAQHKNALLTEQLKPPHTYVPWVTINNIHTEEIEQAALDDLVKLICETYLDSDKPSACFKNNSF